MTDSVQFNLIGLDTLLKKLDAVTYDMKRKGGRFALRKAAQVVRDAAKKNALRIDDPATAEQIAENITEKWDGRVFKRSGDLGFRVGVLGGARSTRKEALRSAAKRRRQGIASLDSLGEFEGAGSGNPGGDTFYWRFIEFGTKNIPARPFLRPALENNINRATDEFIRQYEKGLDRALRRAAKGSS